MILLSRNDAFRWHEYLECYLKGYFYETDLNHRLIIEDLLNIGDIEGYKNYLNSLNGEFSMLRESEDFIVAAVDFNRSFPLYYKNKNNTLVISDSIKGILNLIKEPKVDDIAVRELRISGTTFGDRTLFEDIKTLGCGEMLFYDKSSGELIVEEYMEFDKEPFSTAPLSELVEEMNEVYTNAVANSLLPLKERTIVVPLTSGWWQRVLISKIKELGFKNVICYTYGGRNNPAVPEARKIAEYYGYPWYFIEYDAFEWFKWFTGKDYKKYRDYASQYVTVPNLGEYLAVKAMTERKIVPENAVFINVCFTGVLRGDLLPKIFLDESNLDEDNLNYEIMREIGSNIKWNRKDYQLMNEYIKDIFVRHRDKEEFKKKSIVWKFKYAYWKERVGKHLSNSRRIYEMYGYVWRNIQLEKNIIKFWSKVPNDMRYLTALQHEYDMIYNSELIEAVGIKPESMRRTLVPNIKDKFRARFPKYYRRIDFLNKSKALTNAYDEHPLLWYNIISRREFERFKESVSSITGVQSIKYLRDFFKENDHNF